MEIQYKRGTTESCAAYLGAAGEIVIDMEEKKLYIHDGITVGGHALGSGGTPLFIWHPAVTDDLGTHNEGAAVSVLLRAVSAFDTEIRYTIKSGSLPAGLSINPATGMLEGTMPELQAVTPYTFTVEATDGFNTLTRTFTITVNADNDSPVWVTPSDLGVLVGAVSKQLVATDVDSPSLTYNVTGGTLPQGLSLSSSGLLSGDVVANGQTYNFTVTVSDGVNSVQRTFSALAGAAPGEAIFTTVGVHNWTAPDGVTSVSVLCIGGGGGGSNGGSADNGGGGGGGGGLRYANEVPVVPGQTYSVVVGDGGLGGWHAIITNGGSSSFADVLTATGGGSAQASTGGSRLGGGGTALGGNIGGGNGGNGGAGYGTGSSGAGYAGGGGGAGGYLGQGGPGTPGWDGNHLGYPGSGGAGAGGCPGDVSGGYRGGGGGGGVGIYGKGSDGAAYSTRGQGGGGGSGGTEGGSGLTGVNASGGGGGLYGGGGAGGTWNGGGGVGGQGAVRIIWGYGRSFPNNAA